MDRTLVTRALEDYTRKYNLLINQYDREVTKGADIEELDKDYDGRFSKLIDIFLEEVSMPKLRLIKENKSLVYDYNEKFVVEVIEEKNYRSAWLHHKRNHGGYDYPKMFLCGSAIEDPERITDEFDIFLDRVISTIREKDSCGADRIQTYIELYGDDEE